MKRLARIRLAATKAQAEAEEAMVAKLLAQGPDPSADITGALAWTAAVLGEGDVRVVALVDEALGRRLEWREVAVAFGVDPEDGRAVENVAQSFRRRRAR